MCDLSQSVDSLIFDKSHEWYDRDIQIKFHLFHSHCYAYILLTFGFDVIECESQNAKIDDWIIKQSAATQMKFNLNLNEKRMLKSAIILAPFKPIISFKIQSNLIAKIKKKSLQRKRMQIVLCSFHLSKTNVPNKNFSFLFYFFINRFRSICLKIRNKSEIGEINYEIVQFDFYFYFSVSVETGSWLKAG